LSTDLVINGVVDVLPTVAVAAAACASHAAPAATSSALPTSQGLNMISDIVPPKEKSPFTS
jgi:hypothetical protein